MLQSTFDNDAFLNVSELFVGIFAAVVLATAFCLTGLLAFVIRNPLLHLELIFLPCLTSCMVGLATVFWDFVISRRYSWNRAAGSTVGVAGLGCIVYGTLLIWTSLKLLKISKRSGSIAQSELLRPSISNERQAEQWGDQRFYQNYVKNMFPASINHPDPSQLSDQELQRQQMLMLLHHTDQTPTPDTARGTFRIDWQGQDQEEEAPQHGYYAPRRNVSEASSASAFSFAPSPSTGQHLRPWDGVWRGQEPPPSHSASSSSRLTPNG